MYMAVTLSIPLHFIYRMTMFSSQASVLTSVHNAAFSDSCHIWGFPLKQFKS